MEDKQKSQFMTMLAETLAAYDKPLPEQAIIRTWWSCLREFPIAQVASAFRAYPIDNPKFAPTAAAIAALCRVMDGRPGVEEAWAISLPSLDERHTVVWTEECAQAFGICKPILSGGDEIGARMAFKDAYNRLVSEARAARRPVAWLASAGWDKKLAAPVLERAVATGLLPAPAVAALLPAPEGGGLTQDDQARANLAKIREMLAGSQAEKERRRDEAVAARTAADEQWRQETNQRVTDYLSRTVH
ncbi:hypothetical protein [Massilia sp. TS11]|uniref:hypothetical protein n=1 Tax=Massilia sp. TS11 TaxID=2908003 RepID=UPI001EDC317B|nr:hypothetical protein [Massilia sp. TS11]MCG2586514.1 hypothetical protein [Massilia sp. TS11]